MTGLLLSFLPLKRELSLTGTSIYPVSAAPVDAGAAANN